MQTRCPMKRYLIPAVLILAAAAHAATTPPVTLSENTQNNTFTLSNGLITAVITQNGRVEDNRP